LGEDRTPGDRDVDGRRMRRVGIIGSRHWSAGYLVSFSVGCVIRGIPEVIAYPAPVGYNIVAYYAPVLADFRVWGNGWFLSLFYPPQFSPLPFLLMIPFATQLHPYVVLGLFAPAFNGLLALAVYHYLRRACMLPVWLCVTGAFFTMIQYSVLRLSLDMLSESLALSLGLFTIAVLSTGMSRRREAAACLALVATELANQLVLLTLIPPLAYQILKRRSERSTTFLLVLMPAILLLGWNFFILQGGHNIFPAAQGVTVWFLWTSKSSTGISPFVNYLKLFEYTDLLAIVPVFLLFLYAPLLPWMRRKSMQGTLAKWALILLLVTISPLILPWFAFDIWNLWAITLSVPLSIVAFKGFSEVTSRLTATRRGSLRAYLLILLLLPYTIVGGAFMSMPPQNPFPLFKYPPFLRYMPSSMLANSIPLQDSLDALTLLAELNATMDQHSILLVHEAFYGFTALTISGDKFIINYNLGDPMSAVSYAKTLGFEKIYWIWWLPGYGWFGLPNPPQGFTVLLQKGRVAIYQFK